MGAVQTLTDRRFRRVHIRPSRRRRAAATRRRLVGGVLMLALATYGAIQLAGTLSTAPFLSVDTVVVRGHARLSSREVLALLNGLQGQNIIAVDLDAYRSVLAASGWIESATLRRVLPSTVEVGVVEREPAALARFGRRLFLIDRGGAVIDEHGPRSTGLDLPIVDGLRSGSAEDERDRHTELVSRVLDDLATAPDLLPAVSQIDVGDIYDAVVLLSDAPTRVHLGHERFAERLRQYVELAPALRARVADIDYVDMRFDRRIVVRAVDGGDREVAVVASRRGLALNLQE